MGAAIKIAILGDEKDVLRSVDKVEDKFSGMSRSADKASGKVDSSFSSAADSIDDVGGKSSQAAGGLGDLGGALALMPGPLGAVGGGMEAVAPAIMGVTGAADLMNLAMNSTIVTTAKAKAAAAAHRVSLIAQGAASKATAASTWAMNAAMSANPIGLVVLAIAALAVGLVVAYKKSDTFRAIVNKAFGVVKNAAASVARFFTKNVPAAFAKVKNAASGVLAWVRGNWPKLLGILTLPYRLAGNAISGAFTKVKNGASAVRTWVVGKWNSLLETAQGLPGRMGRALSGLFDGLKNAFRSALNWVIDKWNNFELSINLPKILGGGSVGVGTPNIPRLANGGIVRARPGGILANIGEGRYDEAVVPLKGGGLGDTIYITVNVPVGASPIEVGRSLVKAIQAYKNAGGTVSLA